MDGQQKSLKTIHPKQKKQPDRMKKLERTTTGNKRQQKAIYPKEKTWSARMKNHEQAIKNNSSKREEPVR
ncbi:hypothetical protein [Butyrivibrio sp. JL13D10]|uniref:hypothetical protein n=1 Tax=Butyrivibrio sp. JL13D10 TaxID=3236815 RepID=UPI0038B4A325